jgi:hypothetical protein
MIIEMPLRGSDELLGDERRRVTVLPYKPKGYVSLASRLFVAIHGSQTGKRDLIDTLAIIVRHFVFQIRRH